MVKTYPFSLVFFPTQIYAALWVCNHKDLKTLVLSIDITSFFGGQAWLYEGWITLSTG